MAKVKPPEYALSALRRLNGAGEEAFFVGGCVRDLLLGRRPKDWDVCTSSPPEKTAALFPRSYPTGIKHGTITVISGGKPLEVTTFRLDGPYEDGRHPDYVEFVTNLESDLSRRDFTMNAMAMDAQGKISDPFGGCRDLEGRLIRCVGDPETRFREDALRILRAFRFSAELGFEIENNTLEAAKGLAPRVSGLAAERIQAELCKTLRSPRPEKTADMLALGLIPGLSGSYCRGLSRLSRLPKNGPGRWAALCAFLTRDGLTDKAGEFLSFLRLDSETVRAASQGCTLALEGNIPTAQDWKRLLSRLPEISCQCAACAMEALYGRGARSALKLALQSGECFTLAALDVNGRDLLALGFSGKETGRTLRTLLNHVIERPEDNKREVLIEIAKSMK